MPFQFSRKKIVTIFIVFFAIFLPLMFLLRRTSFSDSKVCWTWGADQKSIRLEDRLIQTFRPEKDGLAAIVMKPLLGDDILDLSTVNFKFTDEKGNEVYAATLRDFWMENDKMFTLNIPPEKFQKGQLYFLEITRGKIADARDELRFWRTEKDCYAGYLQDNENIREDVDLAFAFRYKENSWLGNQKKLLERMEQYKPLWLKNSIFLVLLFAVYLAGTALLIIFLILKA